MLRKILIFILVIILFFAAYFFVGKPEPAEKIAWGVNFSQQYAKDLGLDWQENYLAFSDWNENRSLARVPCAQLD